MTSTQCINSDWLDLAGRVCVVTGAASGIGEQIARELAACGAKVALLDINLAAAKAVAAEICQAGGQAIAAHADVADPASVSAAAEQVAQTLGPCRVLVNNAAIQPRPEPLVTLSLEAWNKLIGVNLTGALLCSQIFSSQMRSAGQAGSIVHVASVGGEHALPRSGAYCVSKAGMMMLSRMLTLELAPYKIRSNVVMPALIHTPATQYIYSDPDVVARRSQIIPAGRVSFPPDIANAVAFLASDRAEYINGQDIAIDGGLSRTLMTLVPRPDPPKA